MKYRLRLRGFAAVLLAMATGACYQPTFDPSVSEGALLAARLGSPSQSLGPVIGNYGSDAELVFLPERIAGARQGVLEWISSVSTRPTWLLDDGSGNPLLVPVLYELWLPIGSSRAFSAMSTYAAGSPTLLFLGSGGLERSTATSANTQTTTTITGATPPWTIIGAGVSQPAATGSGIVVALLLSDGSSWGAFVAPPSLLPSPLAAPTITLAVPTGMAAGGTFFALTSSGPFVYGEPGGPRAAIWDGAGSAPRILDLGAPLAALLSDGHLVAQDAAMLSVHDQRGALVLSTPAGDIRFIHEIQGASGQICVLTRCLETQGSSSPDIFIDSWEIPLASFLGL